MQKEGKPNKAAKAQTLLSLILENDNMSEEAIIAYLKANVKKAKKEKK